MDKKPVQVSIIAIITAVAIIVAPLEGPIPYLRYIMAVFFAVLQGTLTLMWLNKWEAKGQAAVGDMRGEAQRLQRANADLKQSNEQMKSKVIKASTMVTTLGAIAKLTGQSLDLSKLLASLMDGLGSVGASRASLWLIDPASNQLKIESDLGWPDSEKENATVPVGEGIIGHVAKSGHPAAPDAIKRDPSLMDAKKKSKYPSVLCVPLINNQETLGVLNIEAMDEKKDLSEGLKEEMRLIHFLGSLAAMSIKNAKVFGATKEFAEKDGLTGLYNHRYYQDTMDREMKRSDRYGDPVSILLTDIDKFKSFNDTYGHQVGDQVLAETARIMADIARDSDIACRYGGEEFVLILPQTGKSGAAQVAERLRKTVEESVYDTEKGKLSVTLSVGVGTFPEDARDKALLVKLCDEALYRAKENGRNRVELAISSGQAAPAAQGAPQNPQAAAPGAPRAPTQADQMRLAQAQAAAIAKARALAQAGNKVGAMQAAELAKRIATQRTQMMQAIQADPNLAAKARAAAKIAAQRAADPSERAAKARQTANQGAVPPGGGNPQGQS